MVLIFDFKTQTLIIIVRSHLENKRNQKSEIINYFTINTTEA